MAARRRRTSPRREPTASRSILAEGVAIVVMAFAVLLVLSLVSHSNTDPVASRRRLHRVSRGPDPGPAAQPLGRAGRRPRPGRDGRIAPRPRDLRRGGPCRRRPAHARRPRRLARLGPLARGAPTRAPA